MINRQYPEYHLDPSTTHILKPFGKSKKSFLQSQRIWCAKSVLVRRISICFYHQHPEGNKTVQG